MLTEAIHTPFMQDRFLAQERQVCFEQHARPLTRRSSSAGRRDRGARAQGARATLAFLGKVDARDCWGRSRRACSRTSSAEDEGQGARGRGDEGRDYLNPVPRRSSRASRDMLEGNDEIVKAYGDRWMTARCSSPSPCPSPSDRAAERRPGASSSARASRTASRALWRGWATASASTSSTAYRGTASTPTTIKVEEAHGEKLYS